MNFAEMCTCCTVRVATTYSPMWGACCTPCMAAVTTGATCGTTCQTLGGRFQPIGATAATESIR